MLLNLSENWGELMAPGRLLQVIRGLLTGASGKKILAFDGTIKRLAGASLPAKL